MVQVQGVHRLHATASRAALAAAAAARALAAAAAALAARAGVRLRPPRRLERHSMRFLVLARVGGQARQAAADGGALRALQVPRLPAVRQAAAL